MLSQDYRSGRFSMAQELFQKNMIRSYESLKLGTGEGIGNDSELWCPITRQYHEHYVMCAKHIVPSGLDYATVAWMFGEEGSFANGYDILTSMKNGLVLLKPLAELFAKGCFTIAPMKPQEGKQQAFEFVLLDQSIASHQVYGLEMTFGDIDGRELHFKGSHRPGLRQLYWHYMVSIMGLAKERRESIVQVRDGTNRPIWRQPGLYLRKSMIERLTEDIVGYTLQPEELPGGLVEGEGTAFIGKDALLSAEVAARLRRRWRRTWDESDSDDEEQED